MREPFIVFRRPDGARGGKMYYVSFWSPEQNKYVSRRSVGALVDEVRAALPAGASPITRAGARAIVALWLRDHAPAPVRGRVVLLLDYLAAFWADDGDYATSLRARGKSISVRYLYNSRAIVRTYVADYLREHAPGLALSATRPAHIEGMVMHYYKAGTLSSRTVNTIRQAVSVPLAEAARLGLIETNPAILVSKLAERAPDREILSLAEAKAFFLTPWNDARLYAINLLAATSGMRLGECRGLQAGDLADAEIRVRHNWQTTKEGLKPPKWGHSRVVPVPPATVKVLRELAAANPWKDEKDEFVFFSTARAGIPMSDTLVQTDFRRRVAGLEGIGEPARVARGLTFHSWRHWYVSMLRGAVPDHVLRAQTGHRSEAMTEHYTEITDEARAQVLQLATQLV